MTKIIQMLSFNNNNYQFDTLIEPNPVKEKKHFHGDAATLSAAGSKRSALSASDAECFSLCLGAGPLWFYRPLGYQDCTTPKQKVAVKFPLSVPVQWRIVSSAPVTQGRLLRHTVGAAISAQVTQGRLRRHIVGAAISAQVTQDRLRRHIVGAAISAQVTQVRLRRHIVGAAISAQVTQVRLRRHLVGAAISAQVTQGRLRRHIVGAAISAQVTQGRLRRHIVGAAISAQVTQGRLRRHIVGAAISAQVTQGRLRRHIVGAAISAQVTQGRLRRHIVGAAISAQVTQGRLCRHIVGAAISAQVTQSRLRRHIVGAAISAQVTQGRLCRQIVGGPDVPATDSAPPGGVSGGAASPATPSTPTHDDNNRDLLSALLWASASSLCGSAESLSEPPSPTPRPQDLQRRDQVINAILERKDKQPVKVEFKIYLTENTYTRWEAVVSGSTLYLRVPTVLSGGSKESFMLLLDFVEERLGCNSCIICVLKSRPDRATLLRTFMFLGFQLLPPGSALLPQEINNPDYMFLHYNMQ
ncbi:ornithine decarboxylase antizyme domain-containing protein [Phthorimaea operculella]|nr:ornithine decarboxylase antizyme domain-containing protein [Phthorimaea operculella]